VPQGLEAAATVLDRDWDRMLTFYQIPQAHWVHLRTTKPIESLFAALRLRTDAAKRFKRVENATAVIWKMLLVAQGRFRRLNAPELLNEVCHGVSYVNGMRVQGRAWEVAA
jgi:transposase-like protein